MTDEQAKLILDEFETLKRIKALELLERGYSQKDVADLLGTSQPSVSRMFPKGFKVLKHG